MVDEEFKHLLEKKEKLAQEEKALFQKRKFEIAECAHAWGLTRLPTEEINRLFEKIAESYLHQ